VESGTVSDLSLAMLLVVLGNVTRIYSFLVMNIALTIGVYIIKLDYIPQIKGALLGGPKLAPSKVGYEAGWAKV
jgi:hypothetical protein